MKLNFDNNTIKNCVYERELCSLIKDRDIRLSSTIDNIGIINSIYGCDIPENELGHIATPVNQEVAYIFYRRSDGLLQPVRTTYARKTLSNFERQKRKFGHLSEI